MGQLIDSYSESGSNMYESLYAGSNVGASFEFSGNGAAIGSAEFYLSKTGSPTGNAVAKVYDTGSDGPTGSALATSDNFDVSTLPTSPALQTFTFSGANQISLSSGTNNYCISVEYSGGDGSNYVNVHGKNAGP
jgi:hypothetical protein